MPIRMKLLEPVSDDAVLVGDPRRAFALAQEVMVQPRMSHQARGLWGYTGSTPSGRPLTVQSTGSGGPSAVAVISDLAEAGTSRLVRLGTCVVPGGRPGDALLVTRALAKDGAARHLLRSGHGTDGATEGETGSETAILPDPDLLAALAGLGRPAVIASHDLIARLDPAGDDPAVEGRDLQTAATLALGQRLGLRAAAILVIADDGAGRCLDEPALEQVFRPLAREVCHRLGQ